MSFIKENNSLCEMWETGSLLSGSISIIEIASFSHLRLQISAHSFTTSLFSPFISLPLYYKNLSVKLRNKSVRCKKIIFFIFILTLRNDYYIFTTVIINDRENMENNNEISDSGLKNKGRFTSMVNVDLKNFRIDIGMGTGEIAKKLGIPYDTYRKMEVRSTAKAEMIASIKRKLKTKMRMKDVQIDYYLF